MGKLEGGGVMLCGGVDCWVSTSRLIIGINLVRIIKYAKEKIIKTYSMISRLYT